MQSTKRQFLCSDYGLLFPDKIERGSDFWCLMDELKDDDSGFLYNRGTLADAFRNGDLYGLRVTETNAMSRRRAYQDDIFCRNSFYLLPCFCVTWVEKPDHIDTHPAALFVWTHTRARRTGLAKTLIKGLGIECALNPLPQSLPFWAACGVNCE